MCSAKGLRKGAPEASGVDPEGRVIRGYSVITRGEALGHDAWIDGDFLDSIVTFGNAAAGGVKSRFTHPGLSGDGLGKVLGRTKNFRRDGDQVLGDLHLLSVASESPDGDLASYVMKLAVEDPEAFAASIVFSRDRGAEKAFAGQHSDRDGKFTSPDKDNKRGLSHWRAAELIASDMVDEPAANPGGLFSVPGSELAEAAEAVLASVLEGAPLPADAELGAVLGVHPERVQTFVSGYLERHGLKVVKSGQGSDPEPNPKKEDGPMDLSKLTLEELRAGRPELAAALHQDGVKEERDRCLSITSEALAMGQEKLAPGLIAGDAKSGVVLSRDKALLALKDAQIETLKKSAAPASPGRGAAPAEDAPASGGGEDEGTEESWKREFDASKALRAEFVDFKSFAAFKRAESEGRARVSNGLTGKD